MLRPDPDQRASRILPLLEGQRLRLPAGSTARGAAEARGRYTRPVSRSSQASHSSAPQKNAPPGARIYGTPPGSDPPWARQPPRSRSYPYRPHGDLWLGGWFFGNVFVVPAILLAFEVAKLAIWGLFNFFLPTLLSLLSIFFGKSLKHAARTIDSLGSRGRAGVNRAGRHVQARADQSAAARHSARERRRVRVGEQRQRVGPDQGEHAEAEAEAEAEAKRQARR
jgi:hypothetical protein